MSTKTGLDLLLSDQSTQEKIKGRVGYLCHAASIDQHLKHGIYGLQKVFGNKLCAIFGPQHGFVADVQDNMVETQDYIHPFFRIPVFSLYSETRIPTAEMLANVDTVVVDLQDVGTRIYTYIYTLSLLMEACGQLDKKVVVLDRPNPIDGLSIEGNILAPEFASFVGRHPLPVRHGLTIGEYALMAKKFFAADCDLTVIPMSKWKRSMSFLDTGLPWVLPSPNLATPSAAYTFVGTVLFEGTNISEGRGTTRSLEIIGHPEIEPFSFLEEITPALKKLNGFILRPTVFKPTFQKHQNQSCGGFQIHVTNEKQFRPWMLSQFLCAQFKLKLGKSFLWKVPPYEYEYEKMPIDLINGTDKIRLKIDSLKTFHESEFFNFLQSLEMAGMDNYLKQRESILLYRA